MLLQEGNVPLQGRDHLPTTMGSSFFFVLWLLPSDPKAKASREGPQGGESALHYLLLLPKQACRPATTPLGGGSPPWSPAVVLRTWHRAGSVTTGASPGAAPWVWVTRQEQGSTTRMQLILHRCFLWHKFLHKRWFLRVKEDISNLDFYPWACSDPDIDGYVPSLHISVMPQPLSLPAP